MKKLLILFITLMAVSSLVFFVIFSLTQKRTIPTAKKSIHIVNLLNGKADPTELVINKGEKVQFNAKDDKAHFFEEGEGDGYGGVHIHKAGGIKSGIFKPDEAWLLTFSKGGLYSFHDHLNPKIYVTIFVYDPTKAK